MSGLVFMSYAREDAERVRPLVDHLDRQGIDVWWDRHISPGEPFREAIGDMLEKATCVVVVWTRASVHKRRIWVRSEADRALGRGVLVPVLLDADAAIPQPFEQLQHLDLSAWDGVAPDALRPLVQRVHKLAGRKTYSSNPWGTLADGEWAIGQSESATRELQQLTSRIGSFGEVLTLEARPVEAVRGALREVDKTYRAVMEALHQFVSPALGRGRIAAEPYVEMERGVLISTIENGRGHCLRILTYYGRANGLREWLKPRLGRKKLKELDAVFAQLGTADGDSFEQMAMIGRVLTNESRAIANLLLSGQNKAARQRILEGRQKLQPLEDTLRTALDELQKLENSLGFAI